MTNSSEYHSLIQVSGGGPKSADGGTRADEDTITEDVDGGNSNSNSLSSQSLHSFAGISAEQQRKYGNCGFDDPLDRDRKKS